MMLWAPRAAIGNDTDANPAEFVIPMSVSDSAPDIVNVTAAPATGPVGALLRESVVLTVNESPTSDVDGAVNGVRNVLACTIVSDVVAVSATTGIEPA